MFDPFGLYAEVLSVSVFLSIGFSVLFWAGVKIAQVEVWT